jgi:hypothetical protein
MKKAVLGEPIIKSRAYAWLGVFLLTALLPARGELSGEGGRAIRLLGKLDPSAAYTNQCEFSVELEPTTFALTAFKDKWKVVRIKVENLTKEPIKLSANEDSIDLESHDGGIVHGTFDLRAADAPAWDGLSDQLRTDLAYPLAIRQAKDNRRPEVIYLFAFFPAERVSAVPRAFRYKIKSADKVATLQKPQETAVKN